MPTPRTALICLLVLNAIGYAVALVTGLADPLPGLVNGSKTNAPLVIWGAQTAGVVLLLRGRRAGGVLTLLAGTASLAAVALDGDLGAAGLRAEQVAIQVGISLATAVLWAVTAVWLRAIVAPDAPLAVLIALFAVLAVPASADAKRLVRYDVGGGLAGRSSTLIVDCGGTARQTATAARPSASRCRRRSFARSSASSRPPGSARSAQHRPAYTVADGSPRSSPTRAARSVSTGAKVPKPSTACSAGWPG